MGHGPRYDVKSKFGKYLILFSIIAVVTWTGFMILQRGTNVFSETDAQNFRLSLNNIVNKISSSN